MIGKRLFISFSGGETSALMTYLLLSKWRDKYDERIVVFANTGQENEETLRFVDMCDKALGFGTIWVEADVHPERRQGTTHKVVNFDTAKRNGEPFEDMIKKFGIPNQKFPQCTRELKLRPMQSYVRSLGWENGTYDTAIGIRADEARRRSKFAVENRIVYPLLDWQPTTKPQVNEFWGKQPFRLDLCGYQGNCKTCWKKSMRKLLTIMDDKPGAFDFFERMENEYGLIGPEFSKESVPGYRRTFFRGNKSVADLRKAHAIGGFERSENDAIVMPDGSQFSLFDNSSEGCQESCEINFEKTP